MSKSLRILEVQCGPLPGKLTAVVASLEELERSIRARFDPADYLPGSTAEDMLDAAGRPLLADVLVAQAQALTALVALELA